MQLQARWMRQGSVFQGESGWQGAPLLPVRLLVRKRNGPKRVAAAAGPARALDFDHVGTEISHDAGCRGHGQDGSQLHDSYAVKHALTLARGSVRLRLPWQLFT